MRMVALLAGVAVAPTGGALAALAVFASAALAQAPPAPPPMTPPQMIAAQQAAMARLEALNGVWRGTGSMTDRPGDPPRQMTAMTIRVGPFLDNTVKVYETRGYLADGSLTFHNFNTIAFDPQKGAYSVLARAGGRSGDFSFRPTADGYVWNIGSPEAGIRYTGTVKDGVWTERGESIAPGRAPQFMSEMTLRRVGNTDWPDAGAPSPR